MGRTCLVPASAQHKFPNMDKESILKKAHAGWILPTEIQERSKTAQTQGKFAMCKDIVQASLWWGAAKNIPPLEGQCSLALVMLELAAVGWWGWLWLLFQVGKWAAGAAVLQSESDPVFLRIFLINKDIWKYLWAATLSAVALEARNGWGEVGTALNRRAIWIVVWLFKQPCNDRNYR